MKQPIELRFSGIMNEMARVLDQSFNGAAKGPARKIGFVMLVFEFGKTDGGRVNYVSNGSRADVLVAMKEFIARAEGQADVVGRA